jgi:hypothetical protein
MMVRTTDLFWSIGVLSNMYPGSKVTIPSSAYSLSMNLCIAVNFWDTGPEAIGEDMHMYLKCFFSTNGRLIVKSIFSPISSCNIEGCGEGVKGYFSGIFARYVQAKRHLWGSLDTGYVIRRSLMSVLSPDEDLKVSLKNAATKNKGGETTGVIPFTTLATLWLRVIEAHIFMAQLLPMLFFTSFMDPPSLPSGPAFIYDLRVYYWSLVENSGYAHLITYTFFVMAICRSTTIPFSLLTWSFYEKYYQWVGIDRWKLQKQIENPPITLKQEPQTISKDQPEVQYLGLRPSLTSERKMPFNCFDWLITAQVGVTLLFLPVIVAQLSHLWTDKLEYLVAAKPMVERRPHLEELVVES